MSSPDARHMTCSFGARGGNQMFQINSRGHLFTSLLLLALAGACSSPEPETTKVATFTMTNACGDTVDLTDDDCTDPDPDDEWEPDCGIEIVEVQVIESCE